MLEKKMVGEAWRIAFEAHKNQRDLIGQPYFFHVVDVYDEVYAKGGDEDACIVALLHDVVEDTDFTYSDLKSNGFSDTVIHAVEAITKLPGEKYADYIERVSKNSIALFVKKIDLLQNQYRCKIQLDKFHSLHARYTKALEFLEKL